MLNKQNIQLLNLQQQVEKNKNDIANHYNIDRVLADFGIKILGRIDTYEDLLMLPPPPEGWQYGDAFAVGAENTDYDYYVWTRPFGSITEDYWFNIGSLSIVGPQGPRGEKGDKGDTGRTIQCYTGANTPVSAEEGDFYLNNSGNLFQYKNGYWESITTLRGP
jgi:hypothetical protein